MKKLVVIDLFCGCSVGLNSLTPLQKANLDLNLNKNRWLNLLKKSIENKGFEPNEK